ncbi:MAG: trypsin-like peptidase domain-containing protein [Pirellulales bacterium]
MIIAIVSSAVGGMAAVMVQDLSGAPAGDEQRPHASTTDAPRTTRPHVPAAQPAAPSRRATSLQEMTPDERVNITVYEQVNRSVVNITTKGVREDTSFFSQQEESSGAGSGSVLDRLGHVLTNFHVIETARQMNVTLFDGRTYAARLVGKDPTTDICVLRIDAPAESLFPVSLGESSGLRVGQRIFAIGNPFGMERTLTTGVISSLNRTLPARNKRTIKSIIQVDAAINPGSSGGPLLDTRARLIGMNTAIASRTGQSAGIGFAIPVNTIERITSQLIATGRVVRQDIGITRVLQTEQGLLVVTATEGGPAAQAGIQGFRVVRERRQVGPFVEERRKIDRSTADLIIAVDGRRVASAEELLTIVEAKKPGDTVTLTLIRDREPKHVEVILAAGES